MTDVIPDLVGVTAHLCVAGASDAAAFYVRAFGATEMFRMETPDKTRLMYCRLSLNGGTLMLSDDFPEHNGGVSSSPGGDRPSPVTLHMQVPDCDAAFSRAIESGATPLMPPADMFWGDRYGRLRDPFGHCWSLAHTLAK
jgi:PhnB protein